MALAEDAWFETQYNARAAVPEHAEIFASYQERSRRARLNRPCYLDAAYGDGLLETLDVFPASGPSRAVVTFIHGGYWRSRDKADFSFLADALCPAGFTLAVPNYALCPRVSIEHIVRQMLKAHAWVYRNIAAYGGRGEKLLASGHSAGAHLAAMMAACDWHRHEPDLPPNLVQGALAVSGIYDLMPLRRTSMNEDLRLDENAARVASPVTYRPSRSVAITAAVGSRESSEFRRQNGLLAEHWPHCRCETLELADADHFTILQHLARPDGELFQALERLARQD
ncbi:MAG: alpha/beta hydrolase [Burkholderiales bacterium]